MELVNLVQIIKQYLKIRKVALTLHVLIDRLSLKLVSVLTVEIIKFLMEIKNNVLNQHTLIDKFLPRMEQWQPVMIMNWSVVHLLLH